MKQTINIPFTFEVNYTPKDVRYTQNIMLHWREVIVDAVTSRLNACKLNLFDNRERVAVITEDYIIYYTSAGFQKIYSIISASAMEEILECAEKGELSTLEDSPRHLVQILKALYWVTPEVREQKIEGCSFDVLYSYLLEKLSLFK